MLSGENINPGNENEKAQSSEDESEVDVEDATLLQKANLHSQEEVCSRESA